MNTEILDNLYEFWTYIGKKTRRLWEAKANKNELCVLHASTMGENIYKRLGFNSFGELETYRILEK